LPNRLRLERSGSIGESRCGGEPPRLFDGRHGGLLLPLLVLPHGIEPRSSGYRPGALPLSYGREWCSLQDSNLGMSVCKTDALAAWRNEQFLIPWCTREDLNLHALRRPLLRRLRLPFRHGCTMVPQRRIERRFPPYQSGALPRDDRGPGLGVVLAGGLEPPASRLQGECSTR
jgi:hypothetical protein